MAMSIVSSERPSHKPSFTYVRGSGVAGGSPCCDSIEASALVPQLDAFGELFQSGPQL